MSEKNFANKATSWHESLFQPVSAASLGLFRMCFGLILLWQTFCFFDRHFLEENFLKAHYRFPFRLFEFLHLPYVPLAWLNFYFLILGIAALLIFTGFVFRPARHAVRDRDTDDVPDHQSLRRRQRRDARARRPQSRTAPHRCSA